MDAPDEITVEIPGDPIPQPRARFNRLSGQAYTPGKLIRPFKQAIAIRVGMEAKRRRWSVSDGPFQVVVECIFARPPSHWTRAGELAASAPSFPGMRCGDWDNLVKGAQDAVKACGNVWRDDTQVVDGRGIKRYAARGEPARTIIQIRRL
jgi:Holliday junction resolvase RusA-like endonuclease